MARRAARRRRSGPSYEEVKAQINAREEEKKRQSVENYQYQELVGDNRIASSKQDIQNTVDPEEKMLKIMDLLTEVQPIPDVGDYYTFIYNAKTKGLKYDQHPLIACVDVQGWGFKGLNFHWGTVRNYTWGELPGQMHLVRNSEINDLRDINYAFYKTVL